MNQDTKRQDSDHPFLCDSPEQITADWVQRALHAGGADLTAVRAVAVTPLGTATNAFGNLLRCQLSFDEMRPGVPETVIVKLPTSNPTAMRVSKWLSLHKREYDFYRHVAPLVQVRSPALLYGDFDDRSHRFVLVLEDLRHMESTPQVEGVKAERAKLAVREIARLHGQFWEAVDQPPVSELFDALSPGYARFMQTAYLICLLPVLERFSEAFSAEMRRLVVTLGGRIVPHFRRVAAGPKTLIHGDYRGENLFFGSKTSDGVAMIDWQGCAIGNGLYDVAYFLGTSVPIDERRRIEREALEEYHDTLCRMGVKTYTFENCWRSYRQNMLGALVPCIMACGGMELTDPRMAELAKVGLGRILTALQDLDAGEFLPARSQFKPSEAAFSALTLCAYKAYGLVRQLRTRRAVD